VDTWRGEGAWRVIRGVCVELHPCKLSPHSFGIACKMAVDEAWGVTLKGGSELFTGAH
jgi:hypothetical protein